MNGRVTTSLALLGALVVACGGAACGEPAVVRPSQLVLHVETDAPIPRAGLAASDLVLFDTLRISVHRGGDTLPCTGCVRDFALSQDQESDLSVGIAREAADAVAHVELYARRNLDRFGAPDEGSSLSAWIRLPKPAAEEVRDLFVTLAMEGLGSPQGARSSPGEPSTSAPVPPARWPEARTTPCLASAGADEACVPGGVVWMGGALRRPGPAGGLRPRLVKVSPFLVDLHEVTVGELRASGLVVAGSAGTAPDPDDGASSAYCTYSSAAGPGDDLPVTCISRALAAAYCQARGKSLPTEAQHEYLRGGLRGMRYPWGNDDPSCGAVVFGRDRQRRHACQASGVGPRAVGFAAGDVLEIGGRAVVDLAGNVAEWALDAYQPDDHECHRPGYVVDPTCEAASGTGVTRGGSFEDVPLGLRSEVRAPIESRSDVVGFRCARSVP